MRTILANDRKPLLAAGTPHTYDDKFTLVETLTEAAAAAQITVLESMGLRPEALRTLRDWARTRTVTLRFEATESCSTPGRKTERKVGSLLPLGAPHLPRAGPASRAMEKTACVHPPARPGCLAGGER